MHATKQIKPSAGGSKSTGARDLIEYVALSSDRKILVFRLASGVIYEMPMSVLKDAEAWDGSGIDGYDVIDNGYAAMVRQKSGECIDFPVTFVLHHSEPAYEFYKAKASPSRVGARIRALREERGLGQADLSKKTGIAVPNLSRLESDKHVPKWETLEKIAKALGVSTLRLIAQPGKP